MTGTETAETTWQDRHSRLRRHKLMTKEIGDTIPALYANENVEDQDSVIASREAVQPRTTAGAWYHNRVGGGSRDSASASSRGLKSKLGYFSIWTELSEVTVFGGVPAVERDLHWKPKTLGAIRRESSRMAA